jgi:hypothetical protein
LGNSPERITYGDYQQISFAVTLKQNRPFVSLQQEAFLSILRTASELSKSAGKLLRQFDIPQQQYSILHILHTCGKPTLGHGNQNKYVQYCSSRVVGDGSRPVCVGAVN